MNMKYLAPAGTRIKFRHLTEWVYTIFKSGSCSMLSELIKSRFGISHCYLLSSGRAAFYLLLESIKELGADKSRNIVIVPSYTCYSVPASIIKAGLVPYICDVNPDTLSYDLKELEKIDCQNVLAVTASNLYGIPDNLVEIERFAKANNLYFIDDAAQAMGARIDKKYVGSFGDAGIYSFDKGKNLTTLEGGALLTNNSKLAEIIKKKIEVLPEMGIFRIFFLVVKIFLYSVLLKPRLYWIPNIAPGTGLGLTFYEDDYLVSKYPPALAALAIVLFKELDGITDKRISNALYLIKNMQDVAILTPIAIHRDDYAVFPRVAFMAANEKVRDKLIDLMNSAGVGATGSYPKSIADVEEVKSRSVNAEEIVQGRIVAQNIITFPTHGYITENDLDGVIALVREYSENYQKQENVEQ
ncbi:MAG: DegT/DnrJ/EryC1/StrS family aminotransferase [Candidatus Thiodiazotropha sp. (ex Ctena orbiculata)]|uniref:DegT/DnrJ/EryC1/StrS family aminotransferase n=1 Tax=Candidatus Thiodiazotropha taylori TaxID=2792791 RepID=A0A944M7D4_9GAMM|nr:DegT/DnrJ/EryC1/StrS family aminotransferase [Candidatus Thiodiazotropha taylori]MBT3027674.1 DegT/DnrJ/EryC1/StrS family aminotransferase [Candidatus Thiodiazotropha taylori]MBT3035286.1 DegT/DnrJ/EryC1/StrS family aminotransferase [Candidatus Thiodiazotropha taylori]MBV2112032.1 DegT/DnrJ/EryC1/StrS family aminotransferase [Candidatus Thiodiazotropha taylori]